MALVEQRHYEFYRNKSCLLAAFATAQEQAKDAQLLRAVETMWRTPGHLPADEYVCVVDRQARILFHTLYPETVGNYAGANPLLDARGRATGTLGQIAATASQYAGEYLSSRGQRQVAAFVPVPSRGWLLGVHRSREALRREVATALRPVLFAFLLVCGALLPLSLAGLYRAFARAQARQEAAEQQAIEAERRFREKLVVLQEVSNELSRAESLPSLCRLVVQLGRERLGFSRLGIWLVDDGGAYARGAFGVDEEGNLRDESSQRIPVEPSSLMGRIFAGTDRVLMEENTGLMNHQGQVVGYGTHWIAAIWDGKRVVGALTADDLLAKAEDSYQQPEVLALLAAAFGHLYTRLRAEEERARVEAQARETQKMEAIGRLAGGVAHDFNNLLTPMMAFGELLLNGLSPEDPLHAHAQEIVKMCERAASLTRQLLAFSRRERIKPRVINPNDAVIELERMLRRLVGEHIELVTALDRSAGPIFVDPGQFEQVLVNLVINARDAMPGGGTLTIRTTRVEIDQEFARLHPPCRPGPHVVLSVTDTGSGIPPEDLPHIFEPFFTTKAEGKGTGMGLSIVYSVATEYGGCVSVESELGRGATFRVCFPETETVRSDADSPPEPAPSPPGAETILLVEDDAIVRSCVRAMLESLGYRVLEASGGEEALSLSAQHTGPLDLLLTDVVMPEMSGTVLAQKLASLRPEMKVLYMSGYPGDADSSAGLPAGTAAISKPFTQAALARRLREILDTPNPPPHPG